MHSPAATDSLVKTTPLTLGILLLGLLVVLSLTWRMAATSDIDDNEQPITLAHFDDVATHQRWLVQQNPFEGLSTKPPFYHWLGGVNLLLQDNRDEWALKLPSILSFLITTSLIIALARTCLAWPAALVAGAVWVANFHVVKLAYTARPDMTLTLFTTLALLALQYQRAWWKEPASRPRTLHLTLELIVLWSAVAMAGLTKGPPGLLIAPLVFFLLWWDRQWRAPLVVSHIVGLILAIGVSLLWLRLTMLHYPQWNAVLDRELWDRLTGESTLTKHYPPRWREIHYFMGRFIPWSILTVAALFMLRWWRRPTGEVSLYAPSPEPVSMLRLRQLPAHHLTWAAAWVIVVLGLLALPKGRRADHILPVYAGACVLVAGLVDYAHRRQPTCQMMIHLLIGAISIAGILAGLGAYWLPAPAAMTWPVAEVAVGTLSDYHHWIVATAALTAAAAGIGGLLLIHRRQYHLGMLAACLVMASIIGLFNATLSRAAHSRHGDMVTAFARTAERELASQAASPVFFDTGYVPVQSLMGHAQAMRVWSPPSGQSLVITSDAGWDRLQAAGATGRVLLATPTLQESDRALLLVEPGELPSLVTDVP